MTLEGLFKPTVIFFGLTNSPAIFQTMINKILQRLINTKEVASFIDDVIVRTEEEGHNKVVEETVKRLVENDLYVKQEKYKQKIREIRFLGVVIGPKGIKIEEEKIKEVLDWPTSKRVKDIQKFLGLANYYWQFIKDFVSIARLLYDLVKKDQKCDWIEKQEKTFKKLKERFTKELVLAVLDLDKKMRMKVDMLDYAIEVVLSMKCEDRKQRPVVYLSKSLNEIERNYEIHDKKMLVVIRELENWKYLLESTKLKFKIWTDHKNLEYFMKVQKLNRKQACQALYLSRFNFILKHVPGTKMEKVDRLSKKLD